jgi:hypothetical protein
MVNQKESVYTDHPLPSLSLLVLLGTFFLGFLALIPIILQTDLFEGYKPYAIGILLLFNAVIIYSISLIHNTYYSLCQDGIQIKFGNQVSKYQWTEFRKITWKKGIFALKIGWRHLTPCVRLCNALVLGRTKNPFPLYITPTDPEVFLEKIHEIRPSLL